MTASLRSVRFFTISDLANMWHGHLLLERGIVLQELQLGWFKWTRWKAGDERYQCGRPLRQLPPDAEWPAESQRVDREFIARFAKEQGWKLPPMLGGQEPLYEYAGRPSIKPAILQELNRRATENALAASLAEQAKDLNEWAKKEFSGHQVPTPKTIENQIRRDWRELKESQ